MTIDCGIFVTVMIIYAADQILGLAIVVLEFLSKKNLQMENYCLL